MREEQIKEILSEAYQVEPPSQEKIDALARRVRLGSGRKSLKRWTFGIGALAGIAVAAGFTYPIAVANIFGHEVWEHMAAAGPYKITVKFGPPQAPDEQVRTTPIIGLVAGHNLYTVDSSSKDAAYFRTDERTDQTFAVYPLSHLAAVTNHNQGATAFMQMPIGLMARLGTFDASRRIEKKGTRIIAGRTVDEVLVTDSKSDDRTLLDIDKLKGVPLRVQSLGAGSQTPVVEYDYSYDASAVRAEIARLDQIEAGSRSFEFDTEREALTKQFVAAPLARVKFKRDIVTIYRVDQNSEGDVFVLYSCKGYHGDDQMQQPWIRLEDHDQLWLTTTISMFSSKLAPKGEGMKAQLFVPSGESEATGMNPAILTPGGVYAHLSIKVQDWEFLTEGERALGPTWEKSLGDYQTTYVDDVPDWFIYAFGPHDETWVRAESQRLRFEFRLKEQNYARAIPIGKAFDDNFPDLMPNLFYSQHQLEEGLAKAYRALGDKKTASAYEKKLKALRYKVDWPQP